MRYSIQLLTTLVLLCKNKIFNFFEKIKKNTNFQFIKQQSSNKDYYDYSIITIVVNI